MTSKPLEYHVASSMFGLNRSYLKDSFKPFSGASVMLNRPTRDYLYFI
ncbi:hypothetical protein [Melghiribacillus thermohalophilus]|nr:hypothetical protein [Melghiribacillus thermohalophilus]